MPDQPVSADAETKWGWLAAGLAEQAFEILREFPADEDAERRAQAISLTAIAMVLTKEWA